MERGDENKRVEKYESTCPTAALQMVCIVVGLCNE